MTTIRSLPAQHETVVGVSGWFVTPSGFAVVASRLMARARERSRLLEIEALPDDVRKDIGWPTGGSTR